MITKISAEYPNLDEAELTARRIKKNVSGVSKITISSKKVQNPNGSSSFSLTSMGGGYTVVPSPIVNTQLYGYNSVLVPDTQPREEVYRKETAKLSVVCNISSAKQVEQIIISDGGLQINKI